MLPLLCAVFAQTEVFVAKNGNDANPGTAAKPVATIARAVSIAREKKLSQITVRAGEYSLDQTVELDARDTNLLITSEKGSRPLITGSVKIPLNAMKPCTDTAILDRIIDPLARAQIKQIDLKPFLKSPLASLTAYGFTTPVSVGPNELFADDKPMTVARWPNTGFTKIATVSEPGNGEKDRTSPPRKPVFMGVTDRAKLWAKANELWLFGYWKFDWADESMLVDSIEAQNGQITLTKPHIYGVEKGAQFFAENLLEELDQPSEYFLDRKNSIAYLIPIPGCKMLRLSTTAAPIFSINGGTGIRIQRFDIAYSRGDGVRMNNVYGGAVQACQLFNLGERAVTIEGGYMCGISACNIWNTGEGGIALGGGDCKTLSASHNTVVNCDLHDFSRRTKTYRPAICLSGVGNHVSFCSMHDAPHSAIIFSGNDHIIEGCEFYRTLAKTGDGGVIYTGRDWTARGTEIRHNYFHDNIGMSKWEPAIYFDDLASGNSAIGNVIERCHWGFLIGGGRDNILTGNVIVDCKLGFDCDARGLGWAATSKPTMMERLLAVPYKMGEWRGHYPALAPILEKEPMAPMGNIMKGNFLVRSGKLLDRTEEAYRKSTTYEGNIETNVTGDWKKLPGAPYHKEYHFGIIDDDPLRKSLPPKLKN